MAECTLCGRELGPGRWKDHAACVIEWDRRMRSGECVRCRATGAGGPGGLCDACEASGEAPPYPGYPGES